MHAPAVEVAASVEFDQQETDLLTEALGAPVSIGESTSKPAAVLPEDEAADRPEAPWQYFLGIDPSSILVLLISPLPGMLYEELGARFGGRFWRGLKRLLHRTSERRPATPLSSLQVQLPPRSARGVDVEVTVTALDAEYVPDEDWAAALESGLEQIDQVIERTVSVALAESGGAARRARIYGLVEGGSELRWHSEVVAP